MILVPIILVPIALVLIILVPIALVPIILVPIVLCAHPSAHPFRWDSHIPTEDSFQPAWSDTQPQFRKLSLILRALHQQVITSTIPELYYLCQYLTKAYRPGPGCLVPIIMMCQTRQQCTTPSHVCKKRDLGTRLSGYEVGWTSSSYI